MSIRLKRNLPLLKVLVTSKPQRRKAILEACSQDLVKTICELAFNLLKGHITLSPDQFTKLKRQRKSLRTLADKKTALVKKKRLIQKGGFIVPLLAAALPVIGQVVNGLMNRG